jgi:hypothetical protein
MVHSLKALILIFTLILLFSTQSAIILAQSNLTEPQQNQVLLYRYGRISTSDSGQQKGDALYHILSYDRETLSFNVSTIIDFSYTIRYKEGMPIYVQRYEALFYLQPPCISQILNNNLEWIKNIETSGVESASNATSQSLNYTVEAGTFRCVNVTMEIRGMDFGNLSLIYDVDSGIQIYAQYTPNYGDIIVQYLASVDYVQVAQQNLVLSVISIILPAFTLSIPLAILVAQGRKRQKQHRNQDQETSPTTSLKSGISKKLLIIALIGGSLSLASAFFPWGSTVSSLTYLPLSLTPMIDQASFSFPANLTFILISLAVYANAITAWSSIALYIHTSRKTLSYIVAFISSNLGFASVAAYWQTGWNSNWGLYLVLVGSILTLISIVAVNVHIKIELEAEDTEEQNDAQSPPELPPSAKSSETKDQNTS